MSGDAVAGRRVVVIGAGVAGVAAAEVLRGQGAEVLVTDARPAAEIDTTRIYAAGARFEGGGHRPEHLDGADLIVVSPGVPPSAEVLAWARDRGVELWGEMELGARLASAPYLAITGTNGKTTTTGMLTSILRAGGLDAVACGNIGRPFPTTALEDHDVLVVEVSSFQLVHQTSFRPIVSVLLNIAPDHLDAHGSFEAYVAAKARLVQATDPGGVHVGNAEDPVAAEVSAAAPCRITWCRSTPPDGGEVGIDDDVLMARLDGVVRLGSLAGRSRGYRADAAAAAAAAFGFGIAPDAVRSGLDTFEAAPHRGQVVAAVGGVRFVDDSKATNVHAARAAIAAYDDVVLIAGGRAKGQDLSPLGRDAGRLRGVVVIGEAAPSLVEVFDGLVPVVRATTIEDAVRKAYPMAAAEGVVLLAPACASWDQFRDYAERGDRFAAAALGLGGADG